MSDEECLADKVAPTTPHRHGSASPAREGRGEYAFTHPEWDRPWRSKGQQRAADKLALKELEAEGQAQRNTVLRRQLRVAEAELRKHSTEHYADLRFLESERSDELHTKDQEIERIKDQSSKVEMALKRQLVALQRQRDEERRSAEERVRSLEKDLARQADAHTKAHAESLQRHTLEVESVMKLVTAKETELSDCEARHKKELASMTDASDVSNGSLLKQLHEVDDNWRKALDQQQDRTVELRKRDLERISGLEADLGAEKERLSDTQKKLTTSERKRGSEESSASLWTAKLTGQIDTMLNSFPTPPPTVTVSTSDKPSDPLQGRLWSRILQLWELIKTMHTTAKKSREELMDVQHKVKDTGRVEKEKWGERRRELTGLEYNVDDVRQKQERLTQAFQELRTHAEGVEQSQRQILERLRFFIHDACSADEYRQQPGAALAPRPGTLSVVEVAAAGTPHWSERVLFRSAMDTFNTTVRAASHRRGGYETVSRGDTLVFLFLTATDACGFALEVQLSLFSARWPEALLSTAQHDDVWRGLRAKVAVHQGDVKLVNSGSLPERRYGGEAFVHCAALLGKVAPGQIVVSGAVWEVVQGCVDELPRCEITSLGVHAVAAGDGTQNDRLMQLVPHGLAGRRFPPVSHVESENLSHLEPLAEALRIEAEVFHTDGEGLRRGLEVVSEELEQVGKAAIVCTGRLRSLQVVKPWKPEDLVSAFATIDELMLHHDTSRKALEDVSLAQDELTRQQHSLEAAVSIHSQGLMTELEHRRELQALKAAHQEELVALQAQCKAEAQRLLVSVMKTDAGGGGGSHNNTFASDSIQVFKKESFNDSRASLSAKQPKYKSLHTKRGGVATWGRGGQKRNKSPGLSPSIRSRPDSLLGGISLP